VNELWEAGLGGLVARERIIAIGRWSSAPLRRAARRAAQEGKLIDLTYGRACKWVIFLDSGHIVLATREDLVTQLEETRGES
jgi:extracellular matrix regulatory protein A